MMEIPSPNHWRSSLGLDSSPFTEDGATNILQLLECVRSVTTDLLSRGYTIRDGRLYLPAAEGGSFQCSDAEATAREEM